ncbi:hypothetical protein ANCCAN_24208 [Ancylostoma caninum]|uniref:Uncharacterized protein n=1 Tax=Ancylostoma caninum TaxID=29170 RepID=A0A368FCZ9_ANCCA|nr:hypothetical protein ANCCAN_24208 [Ancylostoma caninum]
MYRLGFRNVVMDGMIRSETSEESLCIQNESEQSTDVKPAVEAERSFGVPATSEIDVEDVEEGERDEEELPEIILEKEDDTPPEILNGAKSKQAASEKESPTHCHPKVGEHVKHAPVPNCEVKEESPEEKENFNRNPSKLPAEVDTTSEDWIYVTDYVAHVAEFGVSFLTWIEIRPAFLKYIKWLIRKRVRKYLIDNGNSRTAEDAKVLRMCQLVCNKMKRFNDFPSTFRRLCQFLTDPPPTYDKLSTFMNAVKILTDVDTTASIYIPKYCKLEKVKKEGTNDEASSSESKLAKVGDMVFEFDSDESTDNDENTAHGSKRGLSHQKYDVSSECFPEDRPSRKKSKANKKAMSDSTNNK